MSKTVKVFKSWRLIKCQECNGKGYKVKGLITVGCSRCQGKGKHK